MFHIAAISPFTVMLIGKTGMGKSTTGNKLLNAVTGDNPKGNKWIKQMWPQENVGSLKVATNPAAASVTKNCSLMGTMDGEIRVLDTEGFAGSDSEDVHRGNLQVARAIAGVSEALDLSYDRVIYFLPVRGKLEKADRSIQDEIEVMWHYFGDGIFQNMVVATTVQEGIPSTNAPKGEEVRRDFSTAMHLALTRRGVRPPPCPPVIFLPLKRNSSALRKDIKAAVVGGIAFKPQFRKDLCAKCAGQLKLRGSIVVEVRESDGGIRGENYSKCHPVFIPKYSTLTKIVGGIGHIAALGTVKFYGWMAGKRTWPGLFNSEEVCANCKNEPGSKGCMRVKVDMYMHQYVEHSNELHSGLISQ